MVALEKGMPNLLKHIENIKNVYKKPVVVAMNRFATDTQAETDYVIETVRAAGSVAVFTDVFLKGGDGGKELAEEVGVSEMALSYYIRGIKQPGLETAKRIADYLGITVDDLLVKEQ